MFKSARIKLTAWYLAIIMLITITFSASVLIGVDVNTRRALESQRRRFERQFPNSEAFSRFPRGVPMLDVETLLEIRNQTVLNLIFINTIVFFVAGSLGYFLAGRTLKPIEEMVNKQKRFVSDAAHELKTPLTAMRADLEVTLRGKKLTIEDSKKTLKSTIEEVEKLSKLTNRLLSQSKYQNGNKPAFKELQLDEILDKVRVKLTPLAKSNKQILKSHLDKVKITGDKDELEELFTNLIENSIKYSGKGKEINITLTLSKGFTEFVVEDFGKGISQEDIPHIFEPFYRADKARTKSELDGYGLGLAISKEIVDRHGGTIEVESQVDKGSTFKVKLPIARFSAISQHSLLG